MSEKNYPHLRFADRLHLHRWLLDHGSSDGVWVVASKVDTPRRLSAREIIDEGLCFGWVNVLRKTDRQAKTSRYLMCPRPTGSVWSTTDKARIQPLAGLGLMNDRGLAVVLAAQYDRSWWALDEVIKLL